VAERCALARLDGERIVIPGLRVYGRRELDVFAIIAQDERGAVELWFDEARGDGGIELHAARPWGSHDRWLVRADVCCIVEGGCWVDRSLIAYDRQFARPVNEGDSEAVAELLARWHEDSFSEPVRCPDHPPVPDGTGALIPVPAFGCPACAARPH
jgi:hypothetical protein